MRRWRGEAGLRLGRGSEALLLLGREQRRRRSSETLLRGRRTTCERRSRRRNGRRNPVRPCPPPIALAVPLVMPRRRPTSADRVPQRVVQERCCWRWRKRAVRRWRDGRGRGRAAERGARGRLGGRRAERVEGDLGRERGA